jgi:hypothetical protein
LIEQVVKVLFELGLDLHHEVRRVCPSGPGQTPATLDDRQAFLDVLDVVDRVGF